MDRTSDITVLLPLDLCMRLIGLQEKPEDPAHQNLFQEVITKQVHRYGHYEVKKYRHRLLNDWQHLQSLL